MAEHGSTVFRGPATQEAFYADKLRFWGGVNKATVVTVILLILLLIWMAAFL